MPIVGLLHAGSLAASTNQIAAFQTGLKESGFVVGRNVEIEYRWAEGQYDRLPALAADLLRRSLRVLATAGGPGAALAAKAATSTVPIVFVSGDDPVRNGLVASLARPAGNITGAVFFQTALASKRLELLRELLPSAKVIAYLVNQANPEAGPETKEVQAAARKLGLELHVLGATSERDIDAAFDKLAGLGVRDADGIRPLSVQPARPDRRAGRAPFHAGDGHRPGICHAASNLELALSAFPMPFARPATTPVKFSRAPGRPNCRWFSRPNSSWPSISRPRKPLAKLCRHRYSRVPTR